MKEVIRFKEEINLLNRVFNSSFNFILIIFPFAAMRLFLLLSLLVFTTFTGAARMGIRLQKSPNEQSYRIICTGGIAPYKYKVNGLPGGAYLNNDKISLSSSVKPGNYVLKVTATDSTGDNAEKIVNLGIESSNQYSSSNLANQRSINKDLSLDSLLSANNILNINTGSRTSSSSSTTQSSSTNTGLSSSIDPNSQLGQIFSRYGIKAPAAVQLADSISNAQLIDTNKYLKDLLNGTNAKASSQSSTFFGSSTPSKSFSTATTSTSFSTSSNQPPITTTQTSTTTLINSNQYAPLTPSTPSTPLTSSSNRLDSLISTYSIESVNKPSQPIKKYPEINFPKAQDPKQFNPTPIIISTYDVLAGPDNRRKITPDDVILRSASDRHQNAIKSISNLIKITDQARSNKAQAQILIDQLTDQYNGAIQNQRRTQQGLADIQARIVQGNSSIANINTQLNLLQGQIGDTRRQKDALFSQRIQLQSQLNSLTQKRNLIYDQFNNATGTIKGYQTAVNTKKSTCNSLSSQASNYRTQLNNASTQSINVDNKLFDLTSKLRTKQQLVEDLQRQLSAAIQDRDSTQKDLQSTQEVKRRLPVKIQQLNQNIKRTELSLNQCQNDVTNLRDSIRQLQAKADKYKGDVNDIQSRLIDSTNKINLLSSTISSLDQNGPNQATRITELQNTLSSLRQQQIKLANQRNARFNSGTDAINKVNFAKQNLDAAIQRYKNQQSIINSATLNIQKARAEEALARTALQELISATGALPFAIVPNGGGNTDAGNPRGNNPSGSPLGPILTNGNGAPGSFTVNSWTNYLSQAFGAGVNPAFSGSVTNIFPFTFSSIVQGNRVINQGNGNIRSNEGPNTSTILYGSNGCGGYGKTRSFAGRISSIRNDSFDVRADNGQIYTVAVSPCTTLVSNKNRYKTNQGDYAIVKGVQQSGGRIHGQNVLCLA